MIGWLEGERLDNWKQSQKQGIVLACSGVGYEVQLLPRHHLLISSLKKVTLWIHQIKRDDGENLYGFKTREERNLFRILIGISGVGPQMAMSLLEENDIDGLVIAIIQEDISKLSSAQGIGKRTAQRLTIELRDKLGEFSEKSNVESLPNYTDIKELPFQRDVIDDVQNTLKTLGYEDFEIQKVTRVLGNDFHFKKNGNPNAIKTKDEDIEALLKASLLWLSNESG